ncbi:guanine nucleotide-binding protein subunit gamma 1-like [Tripterygium wilfordii]|nr:guanine nucleotide-binding protein subunit gamma 1-like [Tripterygium wilfordii]XP_038717787.1 guanine nucleotide-binding protein subunit gamma 1-like [Tripterygium wilfordii]XP_038717788.1 guanine nucleotide-binding protein subunit gamma 1-like [Tripterygium wilfordii]
MESETSSSVDEQVVAGRGGADTRGKHRILAELNRVEQEIKFLEDGLGELQGIDNVSTMCEELLRRIETIPDPLVPLTNGPVNQEWDRWFEGPQDLQGCRCLIL